MAYLWTITVSILICLGLLGGAFIYFLRSTLHSKDSTRIDPPNHEQ